VCHIGRAAGVVWWTDCSAAVDCSIDNIAAFFLSFTVVLVG